MTAQEAIEKIREIVQESNLCHAAQEDDYEKLREVQEVLDELA